MTRWKDSPVAEWHGGKVHRIRPHVLHLMRGQIFELEGCRFFTMGGAKKPRHRGWDSGAGCPGF